MLFIEFFYLDNTDFCLYIFNSMPFAGEGVIGLKIWKLIGIFIKLHISRYVCQFNITAVLNCSYLLLEGVKWIFGSLQPMFYANDYTHAPKKQGWLFFHCLSVCLFKTYIFLALFLATTITWYLETNSAGGYILGLSNSDLSQT